MDLLSTAIKDKDREKDREKEKDKEKEREKETDVEAALYTNCLLLGLDPAVLGQGAGSRAGLFRHSNPRVGEALLHFLLSSLRGPTQSAKDFAGVWPIFDAAQSRDFRKIVQGLINDLEAQGALPRSNSRVSSLATCCGHRFVELLWQLSAHALREVHRRSFPGNVAANPLPAPLTEVVSLNSHAAALIPITKARIALERRHFLENAAAAVRKQSLWSNLAHDLTAEYRALCAEEAYLHKEIEKIEDLQEGKDAVVKGGPAESFERQLAIDRASECWDSLLTHAVRHKKLASGPIEDLIAHREHRYRIDGVVLRSAIDRGLSSISVDDSLTSPFKGGLVESSSENGQDEMRRSDERFSKGSPALDVAEILRRWTHALQKVHKQALKVARLNDGAGPDLLRDPAAGEIGHAQAVNSTLIEHRQHLSNMQVLMSQLKEAMPGMEAAITNLRQQVNSPHVIAAASVAQAALSASVPSKEPVLHNEEAVSLSTDETNIMTPPQLELVPPTPVLKLSHMSAVPFVERAGGVQKRLASLPQMRSLDGLQEMEGPRHAFGNDEQQDPSDESIAALKQAIRAAALSKYPRMFSASPEAAVISAEHYFTPITSTAAIPRSADDENFQAGGNAIEQSNHLSDPALSVGGGLADGDGDSSREPSGNRQWNNALVETSLAMQSLDNSLLEEDQRSHSSRDKLGDLEDFGRPASPPLLMELSAFGDAYDDLLAPMSDFDADMVH